MSYDEFIYRCAVEAADWLPLWRVMLLLDVILCRWERGLYLVGELY